MKIWLAAEIALLVALVPCALLVLRAKKMTDWFVGLQMAGMIAALALMVLAEGMHRPSFYVLSLALALLSFPSGLVFAHFVEAWLR